jgi:uncharacterized membrane protein
VSARAEPFDDLAGLRERKQVLDDGWLLMLLSVALAVGIPWFLRNSQVDLAPVMWAVFAYGVAYLAVSRVVERLRGPRARLEALTALQAIAVLFVAYLWHHAGNLQNPLFLMVFAIPVAAAGCVLPGARASLLALLAVAGATLVALLNAPQLRWYMSQLGIPVEAIPGALTAQGPRPFPGMDMPAAYLFVLLVTFAVLVFAVALLSQSVAAQLRGLLARLDASGKALTQANTLAAEVMRAAPYPTALVYTDTLNVAQASQVFLQRMELLPEWLQERDLFALVDFGAPETIRELIAGGGGEAPVAAYRVGGALHLARIRVSLVEHAGLRYACITFEDALDSVLMHAAFEAAADALLVIGWDGKIRAFNSSASQRLPGLREGVEAALVLGAGDGAAGWWVLGPRAQRERPVTLAGETYEARCTAVAVAGLQDRLTVVQLRAPAA